VTTREARLTRAEAAVARNEQLLTKSASIQKGLDIAASKTLGVSLEADFARTASRDKDEKEAELDERWSFVGGKRNPSYRRRCCGMPPIRSTSLIVTMC
jgi:hypothetical protein